MGKYVSNPDESAPIFHRAYMQIQLLLRAHLFKSYWRACLRNLGAAKSKNRKSVCLKDLRLNLGKYAQAYQKHGYVVVENVFPSSIYDQVRNYWPNKTQFRPAAKKEKFYQTISTEFSKETGLYETSWIKDFDSFFSDKEFLDDVSALTGLPMKADGAGVVLTDAGFSSQVLMHKDSIASEIPNCINLIFFVDGLPGARSGGLAFSKTSSFRDSFFRMPVMRNALLAYNTSEDFFHGFESMGLGKNRKTFSISFHPR